MGRALGTFVPRVASIATTLLLLMPLLIALHFEVTNATRPRQRGTMTEGSPSKGGSVNEAGVFALRGRQEGGRRTRRTTTTTTTSSTTLTTTTRRTATPTTSTTRTTPSPVVDVRGLVSPERLSVSAVPLTSRLEHPLVSSDEENEEDALAQPAALLAPEEASWSTDGSSVPRAMPSSSGSTIEMVVKPQGKVVLPCELNANYSKLLVPASRSYKVRPATWLHDGNPVDMITIDTRTEMSGTGHRYIGDSTTAALHIDNVRLEDDGTWGCTLEDDRGKILLGRVVKLVVLEAPRATYLLIDGRRLDPGNQFVPVKEGSELTLECGVEGGNPPPIITWGMTLSQATIDGPEQPPNNLTVLPLVAGRRSSAHLNVLRGHHNATIVCIARHDTLPIPMNASILLDVQYTPSFAITRLPGFGIPIVEGMSIGLKCEVDSNPSSVPVWQRDDAAPPVEQSDDGWLNFTKITREESGWYKCYTRHMLGIFTSIGYFLNVRYDPDIETEAEALNGEATDSRKIEVQLGGAVTLECDGGCWGRGPGMEPVGGPGPITLSRVVYQEAGEYRCVAPDRKMQDTWRAQLPYSIKVTGGPVVRPVAQTVAANQGQHLDLVVEFCAEPAYTRLVWISEERVYVPGSKPLDGVRALLIEGGDTGACHESVLRFEKVGWSHAGEWTMLVRSPGGIADANVILNVTMGSSSSPDNGNVAAAAGTTRTGHTLERAFLLATSFTFLSTRILERPAVSTWLPV